MKKLFFLALLFSSSIMLYAQATNDACTNLVKIAGLINTKQLKTLEGKAFESKYYKTLFGDKLYTSKTNLPDVVESFIADDPEDGQSYHAFIKDYGRDAGAAQMDFKQISVKFEGCFKGAKVTRPDAETTYIIFKKCKLTLHVFESSNSDSWVCDVKMEYVRN